MPPISRRLAAIAWLTAAALTAGCGGAAGGVDGDANPPVTSAHVTLRDSSVEHTTPDRPQGALVPVRQVTDGDTLQVDIAGERERVRLIGIDTPERGECLADAAADRLSQLLEGGEVHLEVDTTDRDRYGRMLRYAHVDDIFINLDDGDDDVLTLDVEEADVVNIDADADDDLNIDDDNIHDLNVIVD